MEINNTIRCINQENRRLLRIMKKRIPLTIIVNAIEETFDGWCQFYNVETGEIVSVPDSDNAYVDTSEYAAEQGDLYGR